MAITFPSISADIERVMTYALDEVLPGVIDQAYGTFAFFEAITKAPGVTKSWDSADNLSARIRLEKQPAGGPIAYYGNYDRTPPNNETRTRHEPKLYTSPITISVGDVERAGNAGADLLEERAKEAVEHHMDQFNGTNGLMGDGTVANAITGVKSILDTTPSTGTYGGVSRTNTNWRNIATDNSNTTADVLEDLRTCHTSLTWGKEGPDLVVTNRTGRNVYESKLTGTLRLDPMLIAQAGRSAKGDAGLAALSYKGIPMITDPDFSLIDGSSNWWFFNTKYLLWRPHTETNFRKLPVKLAEDQPIYKSAILTHVAFLCTSLRHQGMVHNGPAS